MSGNEIVVRCIMIFSEAYLVSCIEGEGGTSTSRWDEMGAVDIDNQGERRGGSSYRILEACYPCHFCHNCNIRPSPCTLVGLRGMRC